MLKVLESTPTCVSFLVRFWESCMAALMMYLKPHCCYNVYRLFSFRFNLTQRYFLRV